MAVDEGFPSGVVRAEIAFDDAFAENPERAQAAVDAFRARLLSERILFGGNPLPTSIKPHFIRRSDNEAWTAKLAILLRALEKTAEYLRHDAAFRQNGPFAPEAWELLDIDPGYRRPAVICRPDVIYRRTEVGLLEMNADSPAMMLYADAVQEIQRELFPLNDIDRDEVLTFDHRIPVLHDALLETYREWGGMAARPVIAILDWPGQKTASEQEALAAQFTRLGTPAFTCHPADLELRGGRLYGRGEPIDIVQRRLLFPEVVARRAEVAPLLTAYREHLVCVVNPLRSYLVGCKAILAELSGSRRITHLDAEERIAIRDVLPCTVLPDERDEAELLDRHKWVLKPSFGSGGNGVVIGPFVSQETWEAALQVAKRGDWIVQRYLPIPLYAVPLTASDGSTSPARALYANWNPFFFCGRPAGGIARVSADPIVGISARGALLPTIIVNQE
jgi:uncharacterized circularly permuted ATP-grasp superfamily protein